MEEKKAVKSITMPTDKTVFFQPQKVVKTGNKKAAKAPPIVTPDCLIPMAVALALAVNQCITPFAETWLIMPYPKPLNPAKNIIHLILLAKKNLKMFKKKA